MSKKCRNHCESTRRSAGETGRQPQKMPGFAGQCGAKSGVQIPAPKKKPRDSKESRGFFIASSTSRLAPNWQPNSHKSACSGSGDGLGGSKIEPSFSRDDGRPKMHSAQLLHPTAGNREDLAADPGRGR